VRMASWILFWCFLGLSLSRTIVVECILNCTNGYSIAGQINPDISCSLGEQLVFTIRTGGGRQFYLKTSSGVDWAPTLRNGASDGDVTLTCNSDVQNAQLYYTDGAADTLLRGRICVGGSCPPLTDCGFGGICWGDPVPLDEGDTNVTAKDISDYIYALRLVYQQKINQLEEIDSFRFSGIWNLDATKNQYYTVVNFVRTTPRNSAAASIIELFRNSTSSNAIDLVYDSSGITATNNPSTLIVHERLLGDLRFDASLYGGKISTGDTTRTLLCLDHTLCHEEDEDGVCINYDSANLVTEMEVRDNECTKGPTGWDYFKISWYKGTGGGGAFQLGCSSPYCEDCKIGVYVQGDECTCVVDHTSTNSDGTEDYFCLVGHYSAASTIGFPFLLWICLFLFL